MRSTPFLSLLPPLCMSCFGLGGLSQRQKSCMLNRRTYLSHYNLFTPARRANLIWAWERNGVCILFIRRSSDSGR